MKALLSVAEHALGGVIVLLSLVGLVLGLFAGSYRGIRYLRIKFQ
jgi:hypothetical protein